MAESAEGLTLQQRALAYGALHGKEDAVTSYETDSSGGRGLKHILTDAALATLVAKFRQDPKQRLAYCRMNLQAISTDHRLPATEKAQRLDRYLDAYFGLILWLDHNTYKPSDNVYQGVPEYIPDGLSDMGSDSQIDPRLRRREKIRVNKEEIFTKYRQLFIDIFSADLSRASSDQIKEYIVRTVAATIYNTQPYDYAGMGKAEPMAGSVPLTDITEKKLTVCRHHALYTQVLLQAFGITSRLLKSEVDFGDNRGFGDHANNLVRINNHWYLLDTTNPETKSDGIKQVLLKPIPQVSIDVEHNNYEWKVPSGKWVYTYRSRNNMYYRIRDNSQPL